MKVLVSLALTALSVAALAAPPATAPAAAATAPAPAAAPAGHTGMGMPGAAHSAAPADMSKAAAPLNKKGKVLTVLDAKQFTYMEIQDGSKKVWVASPALAVKVGNNVSYADGEAMPKFHSATLNRDFTNLVMTSRAVVDK